RPLRARSRVSSSGCPRASLSRNEWGACAAKHDRDACLNLIAWKEPDFVSLDRSGREGRSPCRLQSGSIEPIADDGHERRTVVEILIDLATPGVVIDPCQNQPALGDLADCLTFLARDDQRFGIPVISQDVVVTRRF